MTSKRCFGAKSVLPPRKTSRSRKMNTLDRRGFFKSLIVAVAMATCPSLDLPCIEKPRRLKVKWSIEAEQDLIALYNLKREEVLAALATVDLHDRRHV